MSPVRTLAFGSTIDLGEIRRVRGRVTPTTIPYWQVRQGLGRCQTASSIRQTPQRAIARDACHDFSAPHRVCSWRRLPDSLDPPIIEGKRRSCTNSTKTQGSEASQGPSDSPSPPERPSPLHNRNLQQARGVRSALSRIPRRETTSELRLVTAYCLSTQRQLAPMRVSALAQVLRN